MKQGMQNHQMSPEMMRMHYRMFGLNLAISALVMYFVMFTMIYSFDEFFNNLNMVYMALMMAAPMGILMLLMMNSMYADRKLNIILHASFAAIFILALFGMRTQALVGDNQFLRSMIPHHSGAILMCERASIKDPEIQSLCANIIRSQKAEIAQMKAILARQGAAR